MGKQSFVPLIMVFIFYSAKGQDSLNANATADLSRKNATDKYLLSIDNKADKLAGKIDRQSEFYLSILQKEEEKIRKKLAKTDPAAADAIFKEAELKYQAIQKDIRTKSTTLLHAGSQYFPKLDSLSTSLKFFESNPTFAALSKNSGNLKSAMDKMKSLENEFKKADNIKDFVRQRKLYLTQELQKFGLIAQLKKFKKTSFYYVQQLDELRNAINDPDKIERETLVLLNKLPAFREFMKKNSMLASLFGSPIDNPLDPSTLQNLGGLQTRAQLNQLLQNRFGVSGTNALSQGQGQMNDVRSQLQQLQNKMTKYGIGASDQEMPDFKPNAQKVKSLADRMVYNLDMQTIPASAVIPVTTDIGLSLGYKLNDKSILGIGAAFKLGWGRNFQHLHFSGQGLVARSYFDIKLKGSIWFSGGFEMSYWSEFRNIDQLRNMSSWRERGLVGFSKLIPMKSGLFRNSKVQLLWDFLSYRQIPKTSPLVFRFGYGFK